MSESSQISSKNALLKVNASTRTILVTICSEGYFKVHFLFEDYFGDYFQFSNYFLNKYRGNSYFHAILFRMLCLSASISYGYSCAGGIKPIPNKNLVFEDFFTCK